MRKYFFPLILLFACFQGYSQEVGARIKLKPEIAKNFIAAENTEIKALSSKHGVALRQLCPGAKNPELLLYYAITIEDNRDRKDGTESYIKDFLATGKFEDEVHFFEAVHPVSCTKPVSVNDPDFNNTHGWALKMIQAPCAWSITTGNQNVLIGIVDTEFRQTHEDLQNKFASVGGNFSSTLFAHGTSVASIAVAAINNGKGIAGIGYNSRIAAHGVRYSTPVRDPNTELDIPIEIWNLYSAGVKIINLSWNGLGAFTPAMAEEITQNGTTLVLAAGNNNAHAYHSDLAHIPGVIIVSSVDKDNKHGPTGHARNSGVDICAPGKNIRVARRNSDTDYFSADGSSLAAPFVSGTIALMLSVNPSLTPAEIENILKSTADPITDAHLYPGQLGAGRLNAYKAVHAVAPQGPNVICDTSTYTFSNPNLEVTSWGITSGFTITGIGSSWATVIAVCPWGQSGTLTAIVNGVPITRSIQACDWALDSISGPDALAVNVNNGVIQLSEGMYDIENLFPGATVSWELGPNLLQNCQFLPWTGICIRPNMTSQECKPSYVQAAVTFNGNCLTVLRKEITVGYTPDADLISSRRCKDSVPWGRLECYFFDTLTYNGSIPNTLGLDGISQGEWRKRSPAEASFYNLSASTYLGITNCPLQIMSLPSGNFPRIEARLQNQCGWSSWKIIEYERALHCFGMGGPIGPPYIKISYSPNPVNSELTIKFIGLPDTDDLVEYSVKLLDNLGNVPRQTRFRHRHRDGRPRPVKFNTYSLPPGTYYLHVEGGGELVREQIIVT
ncbi:MAG: S8 family peptidase [Bacteroidales bacterium]|nr:S8 family peptidase [Bacteroidales bacterium]